MLPQILLFLLLNSSEYMTLISTLKYHPKIINSKISSSRTVKNCIAKKAQPFQALSTLFPIFMYTGHTVNNHLISLKSSQKGSLLHQLSGEKQNYCSLSLIQLHLFLLQKSSFAPINDLKVVRTVKKLNVFLYLLNGARYKKNSNTFKYQRMRTFSNVKIKNLKMCTVKKICKPIFSP